MPESIHWQLKAHWFEQAVRSLQYCVKLNNTEMPTYFNVDKLQALVTHKKELRFGPAEMTLNGPLLAHMACDRYKGRSFR